MRADLLAAMPEFYDDDGASPIPAVRATIQVWGNLYKPKLSY